MTRICQQLFVDVHLLFNMIIAQFTTSFSATSAHKAELLDMSIDGALWKSK